MALTLSPVGDGARTVRWYSASIVFLVASAAGAFAVLVGSAAFGGLVEQLLGRGAVLMLASVAIAYFVARDFGARLPVPYRTVQVPLWVRDHFSTTTTMTVFGLMLGTGFLTPYTTALHPALVSAAPFFDLATLALAAALFGVGKSMVLFAAPVGPPGEGYMTRFDERFPLRSRRLRALRPTSAVVAAALAFTLAFIR